MIAIGTARRRAILLSVGTHVLATACGGSPGATAVSGDAPATAGPTTVGVAPERRTVRAGESFALDVVIASERPTRGVQFGVQFDPALLQIDDILEGDFYKGWAKRYGASTLLVPFTPDNGAGQVAVGAIAVMGGPPAQGPKGSGVLATVKLTARVGASGRSPLGLTGLLVADTRAARVPVQVTGGEIVVGSPR